MIYSSLTIVYSLISITGSLLYFRNNSKAFSLPQTLSLLLFTGVHTLFLVTGIACALITIPAIWLLSVIFLIIISRVINGKILYGKNNWSHYAVTIPFLGIIFMLYFYDL